jgi:hypothetical protein
MIEMNPIIMSRVLYSIRSIPIGVGDMREQTNLNPDKLFVEFRTGVNPRTPILYRHYTLTHSDITADLFLTIALAYVWDKINPMRDEVLAEWRQDGDGYYLYGYVEVDGTSAVSTPDRDKIFRRELPLALKAIRYGDRIFFRAHPELDWSPLWIYFHSTHPQYNKLEYWGRPADYSIRNNWQPIKS